MARAGSEQLDVDDPRCRSFLHLLELFDEVRPWALALENVPAFAGSRAYRRLRQLLERQGYNLWEGELCPTELGVPNRRRRFYFVACLADIPPPTSPLVIGRSLAEYMESDVDREFFVEPGLLRQYEGAIHLVDGSDPTACTNCFTAAYGRSPVRSGSMVQCAGGVRRFTPTEVLRLLGFAESYVLVDERPLTGWALAGNSLSVNAVREVLSILR